MSRAVGQAVLGGAIVLAALLGSQASEAIDLFRFPISWAGVLILLDGLVRIRHGRSPLASAADWGWSLGASVAFWDLFELVNLRLQNWWYTAGARGRIEGALFSAVSFATVLPAVQLIQALASPRSMPAHPTRLARSTATRAAGSDSDPAAPGFDRARRNLQPRRNLVLMGLFLASGLGGLVLALAFPRTCFPLAWLFLWPICEAALIALGPPLSSADPGEQGKPGKPAASEQRSPLEAWREGDRALLFRLLACGIPLGLVWEGLNWGCARGWVYTVPGFETHKLFEMPLAGFLGYPPFLLEAGAVLALVGRIRERVVGGGQHARRERSIAASTAVAVACALALLLAAFHFACDSAARERSLVSFASQLNDGAAIRPIAPLLEKNLNLRTPRELLQASARQPDLRALVESAGLPGSEGPRLELALRESALAEKTGMGLRWAERLAFAGIDSLQSLASADSEALGRKLASLSESDGQPAPDARILRLWCVRARAPATPSSVLLAALLGTLIGTLLGTVLGTRFGKLTARALKR